MTIESLNELAHDAPDSINTKPGEILFFRKNTTACESLKKLQNHGFIIGYAFTINLNNKEYTKIFAYNYKNDIFRGWMGPIVTENGEEIRFPLTLSGFSCTLSMPRYNQEGKLKLYKESFAQGNRQTEYGKRMFENLDHVHEVNDLSLYGDYFPFLENPAIELNRRLQIKQNKDIVFCTDVASICNIYKFDETYQLLDEGLKKIYKTLFDNYELKFCQELIHCCDNEIMFKEVLDTLNLSITDIEEILAKYDYKIPTFAPMQTYHKNKNNNIILSSIKTLIHFQKLEKRITGRHK